MKMPVWYIWSVVALVPFALISTTVFRRWSMERIEKQIVEAGYPRPCHWDSGGIRIGFYAFAIAFRKIQRHHAYNRIIDVDLVRRFATRADRTRAWCFILIMHLLMMVLLIGGLVFR
ncbi:hypothetical protein [Methylocaldum marinum]|nr:hypothetical protein [Methylocaldum marinum]